MDRGSAGSDEVNGTAVAGRTKREKVRILIIRLGAIGDVICTLPALAAIKSSIDDATITWVVERGACHSLLDGNPFIDEIVPVDMAHWRQ